MLWEERQNRERSEKAYADTPLTWDEYQDISKCPAGAQQRENMLKRLMLDTVPEDLRGIVEISIKRAKGYRV